MEITNKVVLRAGEIGNNIKEMRQRLRLERVRNSVIFQSEQVDEANGMPRLIYNHTETITGLAGIVGVGSAVMRNKIREAVEEGVIPEPVRHSGNNRVLLTNQDCNDLMDAWGIPRYSVANRKLKKSVTAVANQKGGIAKTTTTIHLATAAALDYTLRPRVLVIDLDPQGSIFQFIAGDGSDKQYLTLADILLGKDFEPDSDYAEYLTQLSDEDIIRQCPFKTHLSNLDIIPASSFDSRLSDNMPAMSNEEPHRVFERWHNEFLPVLQETYDIIIIDTPPADSPLTWLALDVADIIITPLSPKELDFDSTGSFLGGLPHRFSSLPSNGDNLRFLRIVLTNHDTKSKGECDTKQQAFEAADETLMDAEFVCSEAFKVSAKHHRTVLDVKQSEKLFSAKSLNHAINSTQTVYSNYSKLLQRL